MQNQKASLGTVLVTGGAKGIGHAISECLAAAGWDLILCARDQAALEQVAQALRAQYGREVRALGADLSKKGAVGEIFARLNKSDIFPSALVCNAGNYGELGNLSEIDLQAWKASFDLNFFSAAEMMQAFILESKRRAVPGRKKIVVVSGSGLGGSSVPPGISAYACAKAALYRLTEVLHEEECPNGFDINCIAPGVVKTGIIDQAIQAGREKLGALFDLSQKVSKEGGTAPELTGNMIVKLLSPLCDGLSGRLVSAKWDGKFIESRASVEKVSLDKDLLRLRRIDNDLFGSQQKK